MTEFEQTFADHMAMHATVQSAAIAHRHAIAALRVAAAMLRIGGEQRNADAYEALANGCERSAALHLRGILARDKTPTVPHSEAAPPAADMAATRAGASGETAGTNSAPSNAAAHEGRAAPEAGDVTAPVPPSASNGIETIKRLHCQRCKCVEDCRVFTHDTLRECCACGWQSAGLQTENARRASRNEAQL